MITYDLEQRGNLSKYEYLYRCIRSDIRRGVLFAGYKLPSKRMLAQHLSISVSTVEQAYDLLASEGYVQPRKGSGFYVAHIPRSLVHINPFAIATDEEDMWQVPDFDFKANKCSLNLFPKDTWLRIMRRTLSEGNETLFETVPFNGLAELREAIARYLYEFKGIYATPDQIIVGAGTEYLYSRLLQLFGSRAVIAIGDPGYKKLADISRSVGTLWEYVPLDDEGILVDELAKSPAEIVHVSPANHFPLGIEMSSSRRKELLRWVNEDPHRYIIEDDYDSELRFSGRAQPALFTQDLNQRVIYLNTFSKTLVPSLRISYMVLPKQLMDLYARQLSFYSCTVSSFEQGALARFIRGGYFVCHMWLSLPSIFAIGIGATDVMTYISSILPNEMRKIHIVRMCIQIPTRNDCIHTPNNVPSSIASSCASKSGISDSNRRDVSETMIPDASFRKPLI